MVHVSKESGVNYTVKCIMETSLYIFKVSVSVTLHQVGGAWTITDLGVTYQLLENLCTVRLY